MSYNAERQCQTEMTMNELEGLLRLKGERRWLCNQRYIEGLQQKCTQLEQDNIHLREENQRDQNMQCENKLPPGLPFIQN